MTLDDVDGPGLPSFKAIHATWRRDTGAFKGTALDVWVYYDNNPGKTSQAKAYERALRHVVEMRKILNRGTQKPLASSADI